MTIPRHLRDIVITEYGVADLRGQSDAEVVKRLLAIADSRFRMNWCERPKRMASWRSSYALPDRYRNNRRRRWRANCTLGGGWPAA